MPYVLWVELQRFYASHWNDAVLVVSRDGFVLDTNREAEARGLFPGLSLAQARAISQECVLKAWERQDYEAKQRVWLDACVDFTDVIEPVDQHIALLDLSLHPKPVDVAERLIRRLSRRTGLSVRFGAAPSAWLARLAAEHEDCGLALRDPQAFLALLPVAALWPVSPEHRERLGFLGYATVGEVAQLPLEVLKAQFGEAAFAIQGAAMGTLTQSVHAIYPEGLVAERMIFEGAVESTEEIREACKALARRVGDRLSGEGVESGKVRMTLELESGRTRTLARNFTKPVRDARSALAAFLLLIGQALTEPILAIRIRVTDLKKVREYQAALLAHSVQERTLRVDAAVHQVRTVFGDRSVRLGKEIELPRRLKVLREWKHATGWH